MKSNKQKRLELEAKRKRQDDKLAQKQAAALEARLARERIGHVAVNREKLAPNPSYTQHGLKLRFWKRLKVGRFSPKSAPSSQFLLVSKTAELTRVRYMTRQSL